jgi:hypothetical protein
MRASNTLVALASALPLMLGAARASAHLDLIAPPPRLAGETGGGQLKTKPCGQTVNARTTDKVTTFTPGQKVDIKIKEYVQHPGYFAVAFDPDGDNDFPFPRANADKVVASTDDPKAMFPLSGTVLGIRTDKEKDCYGENANHECTISVTIPNMNCTNCTLQVTQFMYDKLGNNNDDEYYYQCADIKIEGAMGGGGSGGASTGGVAGAAATGGAGGTGTGGAAGSINSAGTATTAGTTSTAGTATTAGSTSTAGATSAAGTGTGTGGTASPPVTGGAAQDDSGCGIAKRAQGGASALAALGLLFALGRRRRSR